MSVTESIEGEMENSRKKKMDGEVPDTILLNITTNLNTSLVVVPSRSETIADIRGTIRDYHRSLFPDFGEVDISSLEIQMFGGRSRLADPILIGQLFFKDIQAGLFAELTQWSGKEHLPEMPAEEVPAASDRADDPLKSLSLPGQHTPAEDDSITPEEGQKRKVASSVLPIGGSKRKTRESLAGLPNGGELHGGVQNADGSQDQVRKKRTVEEREKSSAGVNVDAIEEQEGVSNPAKSKSTADTAALERVNEEKGDANATSHEPENVHVEEPSSELRPSKVNSIDNSTPHSESGGRAIPENSILELYLPKPRDNTKKVGESDHRDPGEEPPESGRVPSSPHGKEDTKRPSASESTHDSSSTDDSDSGSRPALPIEENQVLKEARLEVPSTLDESARALADVAMGRIAGSTDGSVSSDDEPDDVKQEVRLGALANLFEKDQGGGTRQAVESRPEASASDTSSGNSSQSGLGNGLQVHSQQKGNARNLTTQAPGSPGKNIPSDVSQKVKVAPKSQPPRDENGLSARRKAESQLSVSETSESSEDSGKKNPEGQRQPSKSREAVGKDSQLTVSSSSEEESDSDGRSGSESQDYAPEDDNEETTDESSSGDTDGTEDLPSEEDRKRKGNIELKTPKAGTGAGRTNGRRSGGMLDPKYQHVLDSLDGFHELVTLSQQKLKAPTAHQQKAQEAEDEVRETVASAPFVVDSLAPLELADTQEAGTPGRDVGSQALMLQKDGAKGSFPSASQEGLKIAENLKTSKPGVSASSKGEAVGNVSERQEGPNTGNASKKKLDSGRVSPLARSDDSQIHAAEQLASMAMVKAGEEDVVEESPKPKRLRRKQQGIVPPVESTGLVIDIASDKDEPSLAGDPLPSQTSSEPALAGEDPSGKTDNAHTTLLPRREGDDHGAAEDDAQLYNGEASREKRSILDSGEVPGPPSRRKSLGQQQPSGDIPAKPKANKSKRGVSKAAETVKRDPKTTEESDSPGPEATHSQISKGGSGGVPRVEENDIPAETHRSQGSKDQVTTAGKSSKKKRKTGESLSIHKSLEEDHAVADAQEEKQREKNVHLTEKDTTNVAEETKVTETPDGKRRSRRKNGQTVDEQFVAPNLEPSPVKVNQKSSRHAQAGEGRNSGHLEKVHGPSLMENAEEDTAQEILPSINQGKAAVRVEEVEPTTVSPKKPEKTKRRKSQSKSGVAPEIEATHKSTDLGKDDDHQTTSRDKTERESPPQSPRPSTKKRRPKVKETELQLSPKSGSDKEFQVENPARSDGGQAAQKEAGAVEETSPEGTRKRKLKGSSTKNGKRSTRNVEEDDKEDTPPERQDLPQTKKKAKSKTDGGAKQAGQNSVQSSPDDLTAGEKQGVDTKKRKKGDKTEVDPEVPPGTCPWGCGKVYSKRTSSYFRHRKQCELCPPHLRGDV